ncbi:MAG TPA: heme A synthase [Bacteroidetes bacterium]|nr:heme A synthase [Bacteroidota bacterium]HRR08585.1 COX15/CtaA family protein [Rhodothermales bacterium]
MSTLEAPQKVYQRLAVIGTITLVLVYLVILAGSVVRASGAGMGCPDWPKCFGKLIPPTDVSELPANYREVYAEEHNAVEEFNATKTWTEYINRLFGAALGFSILIQLILALPLYKTDKWFLVLSFLNFIGIGFQAWLGAVVVSSALSPAKITTHMVMALVILAIGATLLFRIQNRHLHAFSGYPTAIRTTVGAALLLTVIQVLVGTQVREEVDVLLDQVARSEIIAGLGISFGIHRLLALITFFLNGWLMHLIFTEKASPNLMKRWMLVVMGSILVSVASGLVLAGNSLPAVAQPIHLLLACIMFGGQFTLLLYAFKLTPRKDGAR